MLGLRSLPPSEVVDIVVPHERQPAPVPWLTVRRAIVMPPTVATRGLRVVRVTDAVVQASLRLDDLSAVRALVSEAVQRGRVSVEALTAGLAEAPRRGSALLRQVLEEVADGARSAPEAEFRALVTAAGLPPPLLNCRLYAHDRWLADPDAYWPEAGLVHETDSRTWHLSPESWEATMRRHARMVAAGLAVLHSSPRRVREDAARLATEVVAAYVAGLRRGPVPAIRHESVAR